MKVTMRVVNAELAKSYMHHEKIQRDPSRGARGRGDPVAPTNGSGVKMNRNS